MQLFDNSNALADALADRRVIDAELLYRARPTADRARIVFDAALFSRLGSLTGRDAVLLIADSIATLDSFADLETRYPHLLFVATIANPLAWQGAPSDTPQLLGWSHPDRWQRLQSTDRWRRIDVALMAAAQISQRSTAGYLALPAHDAVWGRGLLDRLIRFSEQHARGGLPAAVSPYTRYQHSAVPGAHISPDVIRTMNAAFGRDLLLPWKIRRDAVQAFWGKMGLIPLALCRTIHEQADRSIWEDDLEIDRVIRAAGYGVRCLYVRDSRVYRQAPPVFDQADLRAVIDRTLHYSRNIPGQGSALSTPSGGLARLRIAIDRNFAQDRQRAERLIAECDAQITARIAQLGASWVDWGAYRHVIRVGDPSVEVWRVSETI